MDMLTGGPSVSTSMQAKHRTTDKRVRWAISYYIDREQLIDVAYNRCWHTFAVAIADLRTIAAITSMWLPKKLEGDYNTIEYNPAKGDALLTEVGFSKNADGLWERDGQTIICDLLGISDLFDDIGPILKRQLENHGHQLQLQQATERVGDANRR